MFTMAAKQLIFNEKSFKRLHFTRVRRGNGIFSLLTFSQYTLSLGTLLLLMEMFVCVRERDPVNSTLDAVFFFSSSLLSNSVLRRLYLYYAVAAVATILIIIIIHNLFDIVFFVFVLYDLVIRVFWSSLKLPLCR